MSIIIIEVASLGRPARTACEQLKLRAHRSTAKHPAWVVDLRAVAVDAHGLEHLLAVTVRNYDRLQEARQDGSRWATACQAATVTGGREEQWEGRKRRRGRPRSAKDGQKHQVPKGLRQTVAKATTHACEGLKQVLRTGQEKRNKAALCSRCCACQAHTARACPNDRAQT